MTDDDRLADCVMNFPTQLHGWLVEPPPWPNAAADAAAQLAHDLTAALDTAEAALADLLSDGPTNADAIAQSLTSLLTRLTDCDASLSAEANRVADLLDHLPDAHSAAIQITSDLKIMTIDVEHALTSCAGAANDAAQALLSASTHANAMLDHGWRNLEQAFHTLDTAMIDAAAEATHQVGVALPAWSRAVDDLGQKITDCVAATLHDQIEQSIVRELGTLRVELERRIDEAVAALTSAARDCGEDVARAPAFDASQIVQEIQDILQLGPQVVGDAAMVPMRVAELLLRRATGGLF